MRDEKTIYVIPFDKIEEKLEAVPINQTYLEGFAAGIFISNLLETSKSPDILHSAGLIYGLYLKIMSVRF